MGRCWRRSHRRSRARRKRWTPIGRMTAAEALTLSGALTITQAEEDAGAVGELAAEAFDAALDKLMDMRLKEGDHLRADLLSNLEELSALRQAIAARAPEVPLEYRQRLMARLEEWQVERRCAARGAGGGPYGRSLRD